MEKYSYVRFTKLNGDEYWQIKIYRPWYKIFNSKWARKRLSTYSGSFSYILEFQTQQDAQTWVNEDIENGLRIQGLKVISVDEFKPLKENSLMDELIGLINE